jgi:signal transduction histidine kinase
VSVRLGEHAAEAGSSIELEVREAVTGNLDRTRIEQVVTNLITNAIKYGMGKRIEISVRANEAEAQLLVRDQGIGISKADQTRIFQAFERVATSSRVGGLGLGLYIGRQIATAHGGTLTVDSAPGRGTTFVLELPLHEDSVTGPRRAT